MYDYSAVMACPNAETHTPSQELVTRSKLSCLSWNKYLRTYLASSDYEGVVHVWDIATGQNVVEYEAHEKRIWSVDFCQSDPTLLMSGSDDGMVKVCSCCHAVTCTAEQHCAGSHHGLHSTYRARNKSAAAMLMCTVLTNTELVLSWYTGI